LVRWLSLVLGGSAVVSLGAMLLQRVPAVIPAAHIRLVWTLTRVLVEF